MDGTHVITFLWGGARRASLKKGYLKIDQQGLGDLRIESIGRQGLKPGEEDWQVVSPLRLESDRKGEEERAWAYRSTPRAMENAEQF